MAFKAEFKLKKAKITLLFRQKVLKMPYKMLILPIFALVLNAAELITPNHAIYNAAQSVDFGFTSELLTPPSAGKARIYALRANEYIGAKVVFELFYQVEPEISVNLRGECEPKLDKNAFSENKFGTLRNNSFIYKDFDAAKPLLIISQMESESYIVFTPSAGKIYCVQNAVILGLHNARPNLKLVEKALCEEIFLSINK